MMKFVSALFLICSFSFYAVTGQDTLPKKQMLYKPDQLAFGFGIGFEYAGLLGANVVWHPMPFIGFTGSFGYAYFEMAATAGLRFRFTGEEKSSRVTPYLTGLYGATHAVKVKGRSSLNKVFYGAMAGGGVEIRTKKRQGYFSLGVIYPFNWGDFNDYKDELIQYRGVTFEKDPLEGVPVRLSVGYKWIVK